MAGSRNLGKALKDGSNSLGFAGGTSHGGVVRVNKTLQEGNSAVGGSGRVRANGTMQQSPFAAREQTFGSQDEIVPRSFSAGATKAANLQRPTTKGSVHAGPARPRD